MLDVSRDILPLTDFKRRTAEFVERLKQSGRPLILTINGKAEVVVLDAGASQKIMSDLGRVGRRNREPE